MTHFDAAVLGLGAMGSASLYELAKAGLRVVGVEQFGIAHRQGSSAGDTRIIRRACFEHPDYAALSVRAYELWSDLDGGDESILRLNGGLMIGTPDSATISGCLKSAATHGMPFELLTAAQTRSRFPLFRLPPKHVAFYEAEAGIVRPEAAIIRFLSRATSLGAVVLFGQQASHVRTDAQGVELSTGIGTVTAEQLVIAGGAWTGTLLPELAESLEVQRVLQLWVEPTSSVGVPECLGMPVFYWDAGDDFQLYGLPAVPPRSRAVKIGLDNYRLPCPPASIERIVSRAEREMLSDPLEQCMPDLCGEVVDAHACMFTVSPDRNFLLGRHPFRDRVVVCAGFSGRGFKFASVVGEIVAQLVVSGTTEHSIDLLRPERYTTRAASDRPAASASLTSEGRD